MPSATADIDASTGDASATPAAHDADDLPRRYLALIAGVADRLLAASDPAAMVDELFALIQSELRLDVFFNYRVDPAGDRLLLEAYGGLSGTEAAAGAVLAIGEAVCGCAARDRRPIHATAVQASDDPLVGFVRDLGLDAYACTPLVHGDELIGTLGFGRRWADRFTDDELHFLHTVCHYVALAKHRLRIESDLRAALRVRDRLLSELNHRVRNSLQLAVGLIALDTAIADPVAATALRRAADRIQVLAVAHRPLYGHDDDTRAPLAPLLEDALAQSLPTPIAVASDEPLAFAIDKAVVAALLVHEIVTGRADASPRIAIARSRADIAITIQGLHPPGDAGPNRLVDALARQLRARIVDDRDVTLLIPNDMSDA